MTTSPTLLIQQTQRRLVRQRQCNRLGVWVPIAIAVICLFWEILIKIFALSWLTIAVPLSALTVWLWLVARRARQSVEQEFAATLIDEKTASKDRFLTFSTAEPTQTTSPLFSILRQQLEEKTTAFQPERDVPFILDRRVLFSLSGSAFFILILLFLPPLFSPAENSEAALPTDSTVITQQDVEKLEEAARILMRKDASPQEQAVGKQLQSLAEKLKDPALSPEEKQQHIKETQQKIQLSVPQFLPFDLKIFANDSKDNNGDGDQKDQSQKDAQKNGNSSSNSDQPTTQGKNTSSGSKEQQQPGSQNDQQQAKNQPQPKEGGGGIKFDQPQQKPGEKKEQQGEGPGEQQQSQSNQAPNSQSPGTDPNRPGGNDSSQQGHQKSGQTPNPDQPGQGEGGKGSTVSGGRGERFTKPGDKPGGFLTQDTRFVKVRIPMGNAPQGRGDTLADNYDPAQPKTPYSNVPLKDIPPDVLQPTQHIPLEYRTILK